MRTLLKFITLAAGMILLLGTFQWVRLNVQPRTWGWDETAGVLVWGTFIDQLVMGGAVVALLERERIQRGRIPGIVLAAGLVGTTLVGMVATFTSYPDQANWAETLALFSALGLVFVLAATRRWKLLWLGMAALLGVFTQVTWLVLLAMSF